MYALVCFYVCLCIHELMLLDSFLINFICNCVLCMHEFAFMYDYVYMSLCFILRERPFNLKGRGGYVFFLKNILIPNVAEKNILILL
jgi:hypothetical protein